MCWIRKKFGLNTKFVYKTLFNYSILSDFGLTIKLFLKEELGFKKMFRAICCYTKILLRVSIFQTQYCRQFFKIFIVSNRFVQILKVICNARHKLATFENCAESPNPVKTLVKQQLSLRPDRKSPGYIGMCKRNN